MILPASFIAMTLLFLLLFYRGTGRDKSVLVFSIVWIGLIGGLAAGGFFEKTDTIPPRFLIVLFGNLTLVLFALIRLGKREMSAAHAWLIHSLRIPVELTLYFLFLGDLVPEIMTFKGLNFDILIGISAILFLFISKSGWKPSRRLLILWNYLGLVFLLNIVLIAILSAPLPIQMLSFDQPNIAVTRFPYVLLPAYIVPIVLTTHILSLKKLHRKA